MLFKINEKIKHQAMFQHVYVVVFSLLVGRIPVPDLKLHKVSSVLSQAATIFNESGQRGLPGLKHLGRTLKIRVSLKATFIKTTALAVASLRNKVALFAQ